MYLNYLLKCRSRSLICLMKTHDYVYFSYFREREKFDLLQSPDDGTLTHPTSKEAKKAAKKAAKAAKKKASTASAASHATSNGDWTWKDQVDMVKWTESMINVSGKGHFCGYLQFNLHIYRFYCTF